MHNFAFLSWFWPAGRHLEVVRLSVTLTAALTAFAGSELVYRLQVIRNLSRGYSCAQCTRIRQHRTVCT